MMKIKLIELTGMEQSYDWQVSEGWVEEMLQENAEDDDLEAGLFRKDGPMELSLWVYRNEDEVFFRARLSGHLGSTCVRCLEQVSLPLELEFGGIYCPQSQADSDEHDDPSHYFYSGEEIDFSPTVAEHIFMDLPLNPRCEDAGEECSAELLAEQKQANDASGFEEDKPEIDARWAALAQIKASMAKK